MVETFVAAIVQALVEMRPSIGHMVRVSIDRLPYDIVQLLLTSLAHYFINKYSGRFPGVLNLFKPPYPFLRPRKASRQLTLEDFVDEMGSRHHLMFKDHLIMNP